MFQAAIDADPSLQVKNCCKSFTIANTITFIKSAMDELKLETVNAWCKNTWSEPISDFKGFTGIDKEVKKILQTAREVGGEGCVDMIDEEIDVYIKEQQKVLMSENSEGIEVEPAMWTMKKFGKEFRIAQT
jgi:hypothetical protein